MPLEENVDLVRLILENLRTPARLDDHPWVNGPLARSAIQSDATLADQPPGASLAAAFAGLFRELMPGTPPRRGKRLDTRWGEFGILAAQYFAPFLFGTPTPASLREAWGEIDRALLLFVFGKPAAGLSASQVSQYKLIGDELGAAPYSTVSDWHANGLRRLAALAQEREQHLTRAASLPTLQTPPSTAAAAHPARPRWAGWLLTAVLAILVLLGGVKAWNIYNLAVHVRADLGEMQALAAHPDIKALAQAGPLVGKLHTDMTGLRASASPALRAIGPWLSWLPTYGGDLAASADLLDMSVELSETALLAHQALTPALAAMQGNAGPVSPAKLSSILAQAGPGLILASASLDKASAIRAQIDATRLSPKTRELLHRLDPLLTPLDDALKAGIALPGLMGAGSDGPKTYMLLAQNEDELRPTGGFIALVGSFVIENGQIFGLEFDDSGIFQDWTKPYPSAPWQMQDYMDIPIMLLRDANWFTDFPTTAKRADYLYAYSSKHSVDGVIAIDQQALVILLEALGPVIMPGVPTPITAENVIQFMRESKTPPPGVDPISWDRKAIISQLAATMFERITSGEKLDWQRLVLALQRGLDEKHILIQVDDPAIKSLLAHRNWDGALRPGSSDFLMTVDANVGYDKVNAVVAEKYSYDVDLTDPEKPSSSLVVFHENGASPDAPCLPTIPDITDVEHWYLINRCYHDYLRVYLPAGASLLDATPHAIPAGWMPLGGAVPARVDLLDEELPGLQVFGTLLVVPGGKTLSTSFHFGLPAGVITGAGPQKTYTLRVQKQPGTLANPFTLRIHLPAGAQIISLPPGATAAGSDILLETRLSTDLDLTVIFNLP